MQKLTIEINSKSGDFSDTLEFISNQLQNGFLEGFDKNESENYNFKVK
ncbi:hypothetical protein HUU51_04330 [Candidatus Gracilibacteria bacterium]|nr:hypothetical protein [Candidatus Gracilibacteria bacterium]